MKRHLFNVLAGASHFVLCLTTVVIWIRSYWVGEFSCLILARHQNSRLSALTAGFVTGDGFIRFDVDWVDYGPKYTDLQKVYNDCYPSGVSIHYEREPSPEWLINSERYHFLNFYFERILGATFRFTFPCWLASLVFAIAPCAVALKRQTVRHRLRSSLCLACGYDLRATPNRCPECGQVPEKVKSVL